MSQKKEAYGLSTLDSSKTGITSVEIQAALYEIRLEIMRFLRISPFGMAAAIACVIAGQTAGALGFLAPMGLNYLNNKKFQKDVQENGLEKGLGKNLLALMPIWIAVDIAKSTGKIQDLLDFYEAQAFSILESIDERRAKGDTKFLDRIKEYTTLNVFLFRLRIIVGDKGMKAIEPAKEHPYR